MGCEITICPQYSDQVVPVEKLTFAVASLDSVSLKEDELVWHNSENELVRFTVEPCLLFCDNIDASSKEDISIVHRIAEELGWRVYIDDRWVKRDGEVSNKGGCSSLFAALTIVSIVGSIYTK